MISHRGFTLIELLVTVFITSIVTIAAYAMFVGTSDTFTDETERQTTEANLRNAELLIQRDLSRIGYHTAFDSIEESEHLAGNPAEFQSFIAFANGTTTFRTHQDSDSDHDFKVAQFSFAADLTDYDGFLVNTQNSTSLSISESLMLPITASDLSRIEEIAPSKKTADATTFRQAMYNAFENVVGVYAQSKDGKWGFITTPYGQIVKNSLNVTISNGSFPIALGFEDGAPLQGKFIYPVVSVTYRLQKVGEHNANGLTDGEFNLVRCYNKTLPSSNSNVTSDNYVNKDTCQVLIRNIMYFELYPITVINTKSNMSTITAGMKPETNTYIGQYDSKTNLSSVKLSELRGFYYRIGAVGSRASKSVNTTKAYQPSYTVDGFPIVHIQGTSIIKTKNPLSPTNTITLGVSGT